jgi:hypothetical protein
VLFIRYQALEYHLYIWLEEIIAVLSNII